VDSKITAGERNGVEVKAVLLDAAGTLMRPSKPVGEAYAMVARRYGAELDPNKLLHAFGDAFGQMPDLAFQWGSMEELERLERDWWRTLVHRVIVRVGVNVSDFAGFFEALYEHYARGSAWECFTEVPTVLEALRARGCQLAVVSNFDSRLPGILQALGVYDRMDAVVYSSEAGHAKPDPAIFRRALDELGVAPERTIHVGDNAKADVGGAVSAGLTGLLIQRDRSLSIASVPTIRSLDELIVRV